MNSLVGVIAALQGLESLGIAAQPGSQLPADLRDDFQRACRRAVHVRPRIQPATRELRQCLRS